MALLNFANLYSEVEGNLSLPEATSGDDFELDDNNNITLRWNNI